MGRARTLPVLLTPEDRITLQAWEADTTLPRGMARRAQVVLMRDAETPYLTIHAETGMAVPYIPVALKRYRAYGPAGLWPRRRGCPGRPRIDFLP
jgi:hypothetical protein